MADTLIILILPTVGILAGVVVIVAALKYRSRTLELLHRERLAMIERGIAPPELPGLGEGERPAARVGARGRSFSIGILVVGFGLALMTLIGIAGEAPGTAVGIGGAIAILGAAFIVRSLLDQR